jgi:hypothetical protein
VFEDSGQEPGRNHDDVELGDLDADGDLDTFLACRSLSGVPSCTETEVWLNNGKGQLSKGWSGSVKNIGEFALGDLDGDSDLDAFFVKAAPVGSEPNEVWWNDGRGNFEDSGQRLADVARNVRLGDVDGDGDLDAVTTAVGIKVWLNNGTGRFTDSGQSFSTNGWSFCMDLGDVDGDGDLDAWFGRGSTSPDHGDRLYINDGKGNFTDSGQHLNAISTGAVALGDLDLDGDLDAYLANGDQRGGNIPDRVWLNDGKGNFTDSGQRLGRSNGRSVELGDVDGDGDVDAAVANGTTLFGIAKQPNVIWLNDGSGILAASQELGNSATTAVALGDIDKDGDVDAIFSNLGDDNEVWFNTQPIAGDANRDGVFNSSDLILVFQAGEYEDGITGNSTWAEGDWNGDGNFDSSDLIIAFQCGCYVDAAIPGSMFESTAPHRESLIVKRRGLFSDIHDRSLNANAIDQVFEHVLR